MRTDSVAGSQRGPGGLRSRHGFTLVEVMIALVITSVIGAAVTSVFITQARFYDRQEKVSAARGVSRAGLNILTSELRMIERGNGVIQATPDSVVLRVPYAMGISCSAVPLNPNTLALRYLPTDTLVLRYDTVYSGLAWLGDTGHYNYIDNALVMPTLHAGAAACAAVGVRTIPGGGTMTVPILAAATVPVGRPVLIYQRVTYRFKPSVEFPGQRALWRRTNRNGRDEELAAPFAPTARFRFFINDSPGPFDWAPAPANLHQLTGVQVVLDGLSQRREADGTFQTVPLATSIFFKNRL